MKFGSNLWFLWNSYIPALKSKLREAKAHHDFMREHKWVL